MTTSIRVTVSGNYARDVTIGDKTERVGPNGERSIHHGECADVLVTIGPEYPCEPGAKREPEKMVDAGDKAE